MKAPERLKVLRDHFLHARRDLGVFNAKKSLKYFISSFPIISSLYPQGFSLHRYVCMSFKGMQLYYLQEQKFVELCIYVE